MERRTHLFSNDTASGLIGTFNDAIKLANSLRSHMKYYCTQKGYSCIILISISENRNGGKLLVGPKGKKLYKSKTNSKIPPHLHITCVGSPASTINKEITKYISSVFNVEENMISERCNIEHYDYKRISYVIKQSLKFRSLCVGDLSILGNLGKSFIEQSNKVYSELHISSKPIFPIRISN